MRSLRVTGREVKKNRRRGALNVIIIWQEDKSKTGEE